MIDSISPITHSTDGRKITYQIYSNKRSPLNESILIITDLDNNIVSFHSFAFILTNITHKNGVNIIDLRNKNRKNITSPLRIVSEQKKGSLSFLRYFLKNPQEKKYLEKMKEKYPEKKNIKSKRSFSPLLLLIAHYCELSNLLEENEQEVDNAFISEKLINYETYLTETIHQHLKVIGKPLYLKGKKNLLDFHLTREPPSNMISKLVDEELLHPVSKQQDLAVLVPGIEGMRKSIAEQIPLFSKNTTASISHILNSEDRLFALPGERFPVVIVGEQEVRRSIIINLIKHSNARFLIFDPLEEYGKIANANPHVRGYHLGENFLLNITSTEGEKIREQIYAYWFAKIIAHLANLRSDIEKTLETYLLGCYHDEQNKSRTELQFKKFANQEITSEVTKMSRNESSIVQNVLYPLGTYQEIAMVTKIGRSHTLETFFETKGSIIQFARNDEQLTKIAYLFTLLKLRAIQNEEPKILVLENLDEIIADGNNQNLELSNLILGLAEKYFLVLGVRSPSKIEEIFKNAKTKLINRLTNFQDQRLLEKEYNFTNSDISLINRMTDRDFYLLIPELSKGMTLRIDNLPKTHARVVVSDYERESSKRILQSETLLRKEGIPPEVRKALFEIIKVLREKPKKMLPVEGFENLISGCPDVDILRALEIAKNESLLKVLEGSSEDSSEVLNLYKLTEIGEEYYKAYLSLQQKIPSLNIKTLVDEKNFEQNIYTKLSEIKDLIREESFLEGIKGMVEVAAYILAVLPEEERFMSGKSAAQVLDQWSYLSSMIETQNENKVVIHYEEFYECITNALKYIKHQLLERVVVTSEMKQQIKSEKPSIKTTKIEFDDEESEFEFNMDELDSPTVKKKETVESSSSEGLKKKENGSMFHAAEEDLEIAGFGKRDGNGNFTHKSNKKNESAEEMMQYDPFEPDIEDKSQFDMYFDQQKAKVASLKKQLMNEIAKNLQVEKISDEQFAWKHLKTLFSKKVDNKYTISEIVVLLTKLDADVQEEALISEEIISRLEKLIHSPHLLDEKTKTELVYYLKE